LPDEFNDAVRAAADLRKKIGCEFAVMLPFDDPLAVELPLDPARDTPLYQPSSGIVAVAATTYHPKNPMPLFHPPRARCGLPT
jgi:hypothetical protein